jgi:hypothetical protein
VSRCVSGGGEGAAVCTADAGSGRVTVTSSVMKRAVCEGSAENRAVVTALLGTMQAVCWHTVIVVVVLRIWAAGVLAACVWVGDVAAGDEAAMCEAAIWQCGIAAVAGVASAAGASAVMAPVAMTAIFMPAEAQQGIAAALNGT